MGNSESTESNCEHQYDSTWEDEDDQQQHIKKKRCIRRGSSPWGAHRNMQAAKDMQKYRHKCRNIRNASCSEGREKHVYNLEFYQNQIPSQPYNVFIQDYHQQWLGDYNKLENNHSYIQWLFPIQEQGVNSDAHILTRKEIMLFREDDTVKKRLLKSYELMLDFYGIKLCDEKTGEVGRAGNWEERFENLNRNTHNNLRITRILKCLGILGFEHYQAPLVRFFLEETLVNRKLPNVKRSVLNYFMFAVLDRSKRKELIRYAFENFKSEEDFVWCPPRIQRRFKKEPTSRKAETDQSVSRPRLKPRPFPVSQPEHTKHTKTYKKECYK